VLDDAVGSVVVHDHVMHDDVVNLMVDHHMVDDRTVVNVVNGGVMCCAAGKCQSGGRSQQAELAHLVGPFEVGVLEVSQ
jgi:hypothetical protein